MSNTFLDSGFRRNDEKDAVIPDSDPGSNAAANKVVLMPFLRAGVASAFFILFIIQNHTKRFLDCVGWSPV